MSKVDYLIVGQGLAGSILSYQLLRKKKSFIVIDQGLNESSSMVAAGIMNPLVLKRLTFSWRAEDFLKYNSPFYEELNSFFKQKFYSEIELKKVIKSEDELNYWKKKSLELHLSEYISNSFTSSKKNAKPISDCHLGDVKRSSWINLKSFLLNYREYLKEKQLLVSEPFDHQLIDLRKYKNIEFDKIVFCEGKNGYKNPFFDFVSFSATKGELLTIKSEELNSEAILKKGVFILPIGDNLYKVGATYEWQWADEKPSQKKKEILIDLLKEIICCKFTIVNHEAGVRPSVKDRRPIIGASPLVPHFYFFNGLGSRGCLMAPLLAKELINFIETGTPLHEEANLIRFLSKPG
jgi:glycine/D-amino acid oxidase-like deaminating enzyme